MTMAMAATGDGYGCEYGYDSPAMVMTYGSGNGDVVVVVVIVVAAVAVVAVVVVMGIVVVVDAHTSERPFPTSATSADPTKQTPSQQLQRANGLAVARALRSIVFETVAIERAVVAVATTIVAAATFASATTCHYDCLPKSFSVLAHRPVTRHNAKSFARCNC